LEKRKRIIKVGKVKCKKMKKDRITKVMSPEEVKIAWLSSIIYIKKEDKKKAMEEVNAMKAAIKKK
jgi:hypothetical protein